MRNGVAQGHGLGPVNDDTPKYGFDDITDRNLIGEVFPEVSGGPDFHKELFINTIAHVNENRCVRVRDPNGGGVEENPRPV